MCLYIKHETRDRIVKMIRLITHFGVSDLQCKQNIVQIVATELTTLAEHDNKKKQQPGQWFRKYILSMELIINKYCSHV